jgi:pimeloyl-ACP methyl ester carboxylesterase
MQGHRRILRRFEELAPHTETAVIAEATHMLHTDQPAAVSAELAGFFTRHTGET